MLVERSVRQNAGRSLGSRWIDYSLDMMHITR
jgi:hypothetical protein